jgi:2-dehydropantoate 2-reductase
MRYAILGAGGIGTLAAVLMARGGADVVLYARPEAAVAINRDGGFVDGPLSQGGARVALKATADPAALAADVVILAVKAHQIESVIATCGAAIARAQTVVVMQNGIPWWFFAGRSGADADRSVVACDPHGRITVAIPSSKVVGCVVEAAGLVLSPGRVRSGATARFTFGTPFGAPTPVVDALAAAITAGGGEGVATADIRMAVWRKLLGNLPFLPMSALTRAVPAEMCADPEIRAFCGEVMSEAIAVAAAYGSVIEVSVDERMEQTRKVGQHPPSMLQDLRAGKKLELDALTGATLELAQLAGVPTPATRRLDALTRLLEHALEVRG